MFLMDGVKEEYTSLRHTSTQVTQTDMQERTHTQKRNEEPLLGNPSNNITLCFMCLMHKFPPFAWLYISCSCYIVGHLKLMTCE